MTEEPPGGWELKRNVEQVRTDIKDGFEGINARFDKLAESTVSIVEYNEAVRRIDQRHDRLNRDLEDERAARKEENARLRTDAEKSTLATNATIDKLVVTMRWIAGSILIPVTIPLALYFLNR